MQKHSLLSFSRGTMTKDRYLAWIESIKCPRCGKWDVTKPPFIRKTLFLKIIVKTCQFCECEWIDV